MITFRLFRRGIRRTTCKLISQGELYSWGLSFAAPGSKPTGVTVSFKPTKESTESYEVEFRDVGAVELIYRSCRDYLERHGSSLIK